MFCGTKFWDPALSWYTESFPEITECFQDTVLLLVPCLFLWVFSLFDWFKIIDPKNKNYKIPWTFINSTRFFLATLLIIISLVQSIYYGFKYFRGDHFIYASDFYSAVLKTITYSYATLLLCFYRRNGIHTSGVMSLFWLIMLISMAFSLQTTLSMVLNYNSFHGKLNEIVYITKVFYLPIVLAQLLLSFVADPIAGCFTQQKISPEESSSFFNLITFEWFTNMIITGIKKSLTPKDMYPLGEENKSKTIADRFDSFWWPIVRRFKLDHDIPISVLKPLFKTFWFEFLLSGIIYLVSGLLIYVNPVVMGWLITFVTSDEPVWRGYLYAFIMFVASMISSLLNTIYEFKMYAVSMQIRACLISVIYRKSLKLSSFGKKDFTSGEIVNLMSVDSQRIMDFVQMIHTLWLSPIQVAVTIILLWQQLGIASLAGLGVLLLLVPFNGKTASMVRKIQVDVMKQKDKRVKILNELLNGVKVLKLYAWEKSFRDKISGFRLEEIKSLRKQAYIRGVISFSFISAPYWISLASFLTFIFIDTNNVLDANKAFVSLTLFNMITRPATFLPIVITFGAMASVSLSRINSFMKSEEILEDAVTHQPSKRAIEVKSATFSWSKTEKPIYTDLNLTIEKKKLVAIVGQVGCGKSSLLAGILGDMHKSEGSVNVDGKIAYAPQQPWVMNETLRQNIIFSRNHVSEDFYKKVLSCCALETDLKILPGGDMTEIGEKGINLSGGQKARVSLARAIYQDADIYLMDDPLSAVDAHVEKHIFEHVIGPKGLLSQKTRILVTHRISILPQVDEIIVIKDGQISERGSYRELLLKQGEFAEFMTEHLINQPEEVDLETIPEEIKPMFGRQLSTVKSRSDSVESEKLRRRSTVVKVEKAKTEKKVETKGKLTDVEKVETGSVKLSIYVEYIKSMKSLFLISVLCFILTNILQAGYTLWLSNWSNDALDPAKASDTRLRDWRLTVYGLLGFGETIFNIVSNLLINLAGVEAARIIHNKMLNRIIRAPMSFFDTTPIGRILNRFSKDIDTLDSSLTFNLRLAMVQGLRTVFSVAMISTQTFLILFALLPLLVIYWMIQHYYLKASRQLKRIDATTRSPVYNHFSETINGISSIRAYDVTDRFTEKSNHLVDENHKCYYPSIVASRWLSIRLEFFANIIILMTAVFAVILRESLSPGIAGVSISYSLQITTMLSMFVRCFTDLENNIVSAERCLEYTKTELEAEWDIEETRPEQWWPEKGQILFNNYSTKYREGLELVLKKICFEVMPHEKVGVVGRTGAGKSSLTLALFRLIEPVDGSIMIDDVDISVLGLYDLRSKLTIIPQDPALFTGTLRFNLDPFNKYKDDQLWNALELAHLKTFVSGLEKGLEHPITEGGENLSVGQKQLVCLARAVLRKSKILVLDEATAAVDIETDSLIQETIRKQFAECTIMTIAHRLNTIIDYDRILVMDKGQVAEFDSPQVLLANPNSLFYSMAKEAGLV